MSGCPLEQTVERGGRKKQEKLWLCHLMSHGAWHSFTRVKNAREYQSRELVTFCHIRIHQPTRVSEALPEFYRTVHIIIYCSC